MLLTNLQNQTKIYSQFAGLIYLLIAVVGGFSIAYMPSVIVADGNAMLTMQNLLEHQDLFRWGITGDIIVLILEIILTVMIYQIFKSTSRTGISIATYSRFAMAIIMGMNLLNYVIPAIILSSPEYLVSFTESQLASLTLLFFKVHKYGELTWQIFFSVHLLGLGYVIWKSNKMPKYLGVLMIIGAFGYAGDSFVQLIFVNSEVFSVIFSLLLVVAVIAELWFAFWLLFRGIDRAER